MAAARTTFALLAIGLGLSLGACGALQGLDKFEKCETDEECGLVGGGSTDGPTSLDGPSPEDSSRGEAGCGDVMTDPNNCGRCGNACAAGFACSGGTCSCSKTTCGGPNADGGADGGDAGAEAGTAGPLSCVDVTTDPKNCGGCGVACSFPNAVAKCVSSKCAFASCAAGFVDCDGNPANGCECAADSCFTAQKLCAKRVFTTSTTYDGNMGGLAGADAKCQARAVAASLPGTYKAWLSDNAATPLTRFTKSTIPYRLVDGTLVANDFAGLISGTIGAPLNKTESGGLAPTSAFCGPGRFTVWSSTAANGTFQAGNGTCTNWTDATVGGAQWGDGAVTTSSWSSFCGGGACGGTFVAPIYCFQQ